MAAAKRFILSTRTKKKNRILIHRKTDQFKDLVRLVRESHARVVSTKTANQAELVQV